MAGTFMMTEAFSTSFLLFAPLPVLFVTVIFALYEPLAVPAGMVTTILSELVPGVRLFVLEATARISACPVVVPEVLVI